MTPNESLDAQSAHVEPGTLPVPETISREGLPVPTHVPPDTDQPIATGGTPLVADLDTRTKFITTIHDYIRDNIKLADQKASFFFTVATALLAFLYRNNISHRWLKSPSLWGFLDGVAFVAVERQ